MAHEPRQRKNVPGPQPLRLDQPETGAAPQPWFGDEPMAPLAKPSAASHQLAAEQPAGTRARPAAARPVDVQPLPADVLGAERQPNWLLEHDGDTPADTLPEVESGEPAAPPTSYVEPETTSTLVSRALAPAGLALVLSFLAVGGFAFWKSGGSASAPVGADPLDADPGVVSSRRAAELVAPPSHAGTAESARVGTLRAGVVPSASPLGQPRTGQQSPNLQVGSQTSPGQPTGRPYSSESTPVEPSTWSPPEEDTDTPSYAPDEDLRSAVIPPELEPALETVIDSEALAGALAGEPSDMATAAATEQRVEADAALDAEFAASALELDDLLVSASVAESTPVAGLAVSEGTVPESLAPHDPVVPAGTDAEPPSNPFDQFIGVLLGAGSAASLATADETTTEVAPAPGDDVDVAHGSAPSSEVEVAAQASAEPTDPAPVFTCDEEPAELAMAEAPAEDSLAGIRLDLDWDDLALISLESGPVSDPVVTLDAPALDAPALLEPSLDSPALGGATLDQPTPDWPTTIEPLPFAPTLTGPTLDGTTPGAATPSDSPTVDLAPSGALEGDLGSNEAVLAEPFGPEAPSNSIREEGRGPLDFDPRSSALATELDDLLAMVGPRQLPLDARGTTEPYAATQTAPIAPLAPEATDVEPAALDVPVEVVPPVATPSTDNGFRSVLRRANEAGTWTALDVPNTLVVGQEFLLTPYTGNVRVVFDRGDVFEGRLHAVGKNRIELDTRLGRMTLDARRLQRIERLAPEGPAPKSPAKVANDTSGLEEVRVTTRGGGTFQGHLVSRDGNKVTLIVVEGYRMTVEALEVTPAVGLRANSSLRRPGDKAAAPVRPANPAPKGSR